MRLFTDIVLRFQSLLCTASKRFRSNAVIWRQGVMGAQPYGVTLLRLPGYEA
jgi:hypothetical protein